MVATSCTSSSIVENYTHIAPFISAVEKGVRWLGSSACDQFGPHSSHNFSEDGQPSQGAQNSSIASCTLSRRQDAYRLPHLAATAQSQVSRLTERLHFLFLFLFLSRPASYSPQSPPPTFQTGAPHPPPSSVQCPGVQ
ncbi:hypothetical protein CC80DRAFT_142825 [Byssothecium circinans]|uniref:Uncharacterized protein n=1 Tax=Byssothecium circinans TaxID=147558 RepID=A0A6A5TPL6_9PLEO|nr:hypothetical protein CC80DRAFT_142825 [Byssothecium circinans]